MAVRRLIAWWASSAAWHSAAKERPFESASHCMTDQVRGQAQPQAQAPLAAGSRPGGTIFKVEVRRWEQHRCTPWRNGGGVTYEVAASPANAGLDDFAWRISIADVPGGGPFSTFPDIDRVLTLIEGEWMALTVDGRTHRFGLRRPFAFDGGAETLCEVAGPSRDLNVMTHRGRATASVAVLEAGAPDRAVPVDGRETVFVALEANVVIAAGDGTEVELGALDAAMATDLGPLTIGGDGAVLVVGFARVAAAL